jgi:hypothetical protein
LYRDFKPQRFDVCEDYEKEWTTKYNKEKVKKYISKIKTNNDIVSPPPMILENKSFLQVNNKLNLSSYSSSSQNSFSSFSIFYPLTSASLSSQNIDKIIDLDNNIEDARDRLLKLRETVLMQKDSNSIIYAVLSQLNLHRWGGNTLAHSYHPYLL